MFLLAWRQEEPQTDQEPDRAVGFSDALTPHHRESSRLPARRRADYRELSRSTQGRSIWSGDELTRPATVTRNVQAWRHWPPGVGGRVFPRRGPKGRLHYDRSFGVGKNFPRRVAKNLARVQVVIHGIDTNHNDRDARGQL